MKPKRYIVWSKKEIDLSDPWQKRWYVKKILTQGRAEDIAKLTIDEIRAVITDSDIPDDVRRLWEDYFTNVEG